MSHKQYHVPVMATECLDGLDIKPDGTYVDLTFGGGGHSRLILEKLDDRGKLFAFDQDEDAEINASMFDSQNFTFIKSNFEHVQRYLKLYGTSKVDGVLADLGVSSHQIDQAERGFAFRFDADLDMRMDQRREKTAKTIIQNYSERELHRIFGLYGEIKNAKTLARGIVSARINRKIETTKALKEVCESFAPRHREFKYFAQVFQALRIEVNDEIKVLESMLVRIPDLLKKAGRFVVLSYHSLEDRPVKNMMMKGKIFGEAKKDMYGNLITPFEPVNRKPILASAEEVSQNARATSAKLRIAKRV